MNEVNELFTKENVEQIVVPQVVKDDLLSIIEEELKRAGRRFIMASSNSSSTSSKTKKNAQDALDRFKMEVASEIGVNLKEGYNGDLTSAEAGSVGGNMVKKMIRKQEEQMSQGGN